MAVLLDGCDFEHWLVVMDKPQGERTRDEIIDSYINTLAMVVGRCYYAFGALVSEKDSNKLTELPGVSWVLPDSYLDVKNKSYGGEPFIDGKAVPYDPKYHEEWIRNNARANERRNERPRIRNFRGCLGLSFVLAFGFWMGIILFFPIQKYTKKISENMESNHQPLPPSSGNMPLPSAAGNY